jgi:ABC-type multidrug transport system ATPase subunit
MRRVRINGQEFVVEGAEILTIGRGPDMTVRFDDRVVSRRHAEICADEHGWLIKDLSQNGMFQDGKRVTEVRIVTPTLLRLGHPETGVLVELVPQDAATDQRLVATVVGGGGGQREPEGDGPVVTRLLGKLSSIYQAEGSALRIGRAPDNEIVVDDLLVSRWHAELRRQADGTYLLVDLGSQNGTFVDGQRIARTTITPANYVAIGHHLYRLVDGKLEEYVDAGQGAFAAVDLTVKIADGKVLLDDVSFSLDEHSFMAVVGPSGSGKSTLLNALTGFRPAQVGSVFYAGLDLYATYDELRQRIGYVPQDDILHPQLSVRQALEYAGELRFAADVEATAREQRAQEVMDELGLAERADLPIQQLSGGQRKRASIALELLTKPSLLFLDEPTSGLDPGFERAIMRLLRDLAHEGRSVVVVTHSLQSLDLCDRVIFLAPGGKVAYFGPPQQALAYFGESDYADVFARLESERETDWQTRFREHPLYDEHVRQPLAERELVRRSRPPEPMPPQSGLGWRREFETLTRRYLSVIFSDRRNLALLLLQAPILGALIFWLAPVNSFDPDSTDPGRRPAMVALLIVLSVTLMGAANAIREIVKELAIYRRERAIGLSISAYVASKVAVLAGFTVAQAIVLTIISILRQGGPDGADKLLQLIVGVAMAGLAAMALGLLVSAIVTESDKALTLLPLLLIPQIMFSGPIIPLDDPGIRAVSALASARWGFAAVDATVEVDLLQPAGALNPGAEQSPVDDGSDAGSWLGNVAALAVLTGLAVLGTGYFLRRRDPIARSTNLKRAPFVLGRLGQWRRRPMAMPGAPPDGGRSPAS